MTKEEASKEENTSLTKASESPPAPGMGTGVGKRIWLGHFSIL